MNHPIVYLDRSRVRPGSEQELRAAVARLVAFVEEVEPRILAYAFSIDEASHSMVVTAVHPDSASLERHLSIGSDEFQKVGRYIDLDSIEVIGPVSQRAVDLLQQKASTLGRDARVTVSPIGIGFSRLA